MSSATHNDSILSVLLSILDGKFGAWENLDSDSTWVISDARCYSASSFLNGSSHEAKRYKKLSRIHPKPALCISVSTFWNSYLSILNSFRLPKRSRHIENIKITSHSIREVVAGSWDDSEW